MNCGVFCNDSSKCLTPLLAAKGLAGVAAKNVDTIRAGNVVPKCFQSHRSVRVARLPQQRRAFSAGSNAGMFSPCRFRRSRNHGTRSLAESHRIGKTIDHEGGQRLDNVQRDISALVDRSGNVQALALQPLRN